MGTLVLISATLASFSNLLMPGSSSTIISPTQPLGHPESPCQLCHKMTLLTTKSTPSLGPPRAGQPEILGPRFVHQWAKTRLGTPWISATSYLMTALPTSSQQLPQKAKAEYQLDQGPATPTRLPAVISLPQ